MIFITGFCLLSCDKDDIIDSDENAASNANQNQNGDTITAYDLIDFYDLFPGIIYDSYDGYDDFVAAIPPGIYLFSDVKGKDKIMAIGTDHSVMSFNPESLKRATAYNGKYAACDCHGDDGKSSCYDFYNDRFDAANDYKPAPTVCEYEYDSREKMMHANESTGIMLSLTSDLLKYFRPSHSNLKDLREYKAYYGGKTTLRGVDCNYYYVTKGDDSLQVKYQELWVTDSFVCLQQVDLNNDTICALNDCLKSGTFADNYEKITRLYSIYGKTKITETLRCHKKYGNYWLSDEYPNMISKWLPVFDGTVKYFSVSRRAWMGLDNISNISVELSGVTQDEVRNYVATVKETNNIRTSRRKDIEGWLYFYADDPGDTSVSTGGVSLYPIIQISYSNGSCHISIDIVRM